MHFDDSDPTEAAPVSSRLHAGKICQLDKPIRRNFYAEPPSFGITGLEIGELFAADRVDEKIARLTVQSFPGAGKPATELFELSDVHEHAFPRLAGVSLPPRGTCVPKQMGGAGAVA